MGVLKTLERRSLGPVVLLHQQKIGIKYNKPTLICDDPRGGGKSSTTSLPRTGPTVIHGFFSLNQRFWREQPDLVLAASCELEKMIALSDTYGPQKKISDKQRQRQQEIR